MSTPTETSDGQFVDLLRSRGAMSVADLSAACDVTATAVRQRLTRLMSQGLVEREAQRAGRGRPSHRYSLTEKARRQAGNNFADLAILLWNQIREVKDVEVRRGLLQRLATGMAEMYADQVQGETTDERMESLRELFAERSVPMTVTPAGETSGTAQLTVVDCPYPKLAEQDRGICALERMMFAELLNTPLRLSECRLDGHACCQFQTS
jgi:predicted ArsR family transcriptional regulator